LPKFNTPGGRFEAFPNALFTAHSREKPEPYAQHKRCRCEPYRRKSLDLPFNKYDPKDDPSDSEAKENAMTKITKTLTVLATAATLAVAAVAAPQPAEARGGRIAAGIIGGLAAGAILGGIASNGYGYGPYYGPAYYGPGPVYYGPHCYWSHQRIWDGYGWHLQRVRVCG
jgi:hypothetical protein